MKHPYASLEGTKTWTIVDTAITALIKNHDIKVSTAQHYVTGYIVKALSDAERLPKRSSRAEGSALKN